MFATAGVREGVAWRLLAAEMRQIGAGESEGDYGFTTIEKLKIDSVKSLEDSFQALLFSLGRISIIKCFIERINYPKIKQQNCLGYYID